MASLGHWLQRAASCLLEYSWNNRCCHHNHFRDGAISATNRINVTKKRNN